MRTRQQSIEILRMMTALAVIMESERQGIDPPGEALRIQHRISLRLSLADYAELEKAIDHATELLGEVVEESEPGAEEPLVEDALAV